MSNKFDTIGNRMKQYENCYRMYLPRRSPVIVRLDMRAGHTFTKGFARPYDKLFASAMWETAKQLCENISGVRFAFTQSDEISLVLVDYESINTEPWFGNNLQKIVSISAAMATMYFHDVMEQYIHDLLFSWLPLDWNNKEEMEANYRYLNQMYGTPLDPEEFHKYTSIYQEAYSRKLAVFDSRAFILPREEVLNYMYWRQLDTRRNSIQLLGQSQFSHNQLQGKNSDEIREMVLREKGIDWNEMPTWFRNGVSLYKEYRTIEGINPKGEKMEVLRGKWCVDTKTPIFTENKSYIEDHVIFDKGE